MSTKHLSKTRDINAEKRQERRTNTPTKLKKENTKMEKLRNQYLLQKDIKELGFVMIVKDNILYTINSLDMLNEDTFFCTIKDSDEFEFNYTDDFVIEAFEDSTMEEEYKPPVVTTIVTETGASTTIVYENIKDLEEDFFVKEED